MYTFDTDILIIGGGAAGIGIGILLEKCGMQNYTIIERNTIGSSFSAWPKYNRFISPSFCGNFFNAVDLNAISPDTSPAFSLQTQHPSGEEYAAYLQATAEHFQVQVNEGIEAQKIEKIDNVFHVQTNQGLYTSAFLIWAGGEFQYPNDAPFPGSELCLHTSKKDTFDEDDYVIIGGYESGLELATYLLSLGKTVSIIDSGAPWEVEASDSSISVAPSTKDRLLPYIGSDKLSMYTNGLVTQVTSSGDEYHIILADESYIPTKNPPILATGFKSLPPIIQEYFELREDSSISLTEYDESTKTPGLFLSGPRVKHGNAIFCFIYKFRQRFPIIVEYILGTLDLDMEGIEEYKKANMYLKDLTCCENECIC